MPTTQQLARECAEEMARAIACGLCKAGFVQLGFSAGVEAVILKHLTPRLVECEKDGKRLDWLEENHKELRWMPISRYWYILKSYAKVFTVEESKADTARQAIDSAITAAMDKKG